MTSPASSPPLFDDPAAYAAFMGRYSDRLAPELVRIAGVTAGERILDVGCGPGALAAALAAVVAPDRISAVEPSEPFAVAARARVPAADVRVGPAESLPFEDDAFDRSLAQLVFHFVRDPGAAVAEMKRVTRPGGIVAACVWDATGGMTMMRAYWDAAREADPGAPDEVERFGSKPGQLVRLWREAGLRDVGEHVLEASADYRDFDELWASFRGGAGPIGAHAASLEGDVLERVRSSLHRRIGSPDGPFSLTARAWCATGLV